jgi:peroxiredoxin
MGMPRLDGHQLRKVDLQRTVLDGCQGGHKARSPYSPPLHQREHVMSQLLAPGTTAPDFRLRVTPDQDLSLSELRGQRVILSFYPADWSPVCGDQITLYNQVRPEFQNYGAEILGISVDGAWCHQAYAKHNHIHFPLLADFHPKGAAAQKYGAYREQDGVCQRALFVIDRKGVIFWSYLSPIAVNPGADGILDALQNLETKEE